MADVPFPDWEDDEQAIAFVAVNLPSNQIMDELGEEMACAELAHADRILALFEQEGPIQARVVKRKSGKDTN